MEDNIDIDEHDVLQNPRIKNVFLDLDKVKVEVVEEESDDGITMKDKGSSSKQWNCTTSDTSPMLMEVEIENSEFSTLQTQMPLPNFTNESMEFQKILEENSQGRIFGQRVLVKTENSDIEDIREQSLIPDNFPNSKSPRLPLIPGEVCKPFQNERIVSAVKYPVPYSILFKCNKCPLHFLSCYAAHCHSLRCLNKFNFTINCKQCELKFNGNDFFEHKNQHLLTDTFKVLVAQRTLVTRVLCQCPKCTYYFDEMAFKNHLEDSCMESSSTYCSQCDLQIANSTIDLHIKNHYDSRKPFIVVNYFCVDMSSNKFDDAQPQSNLNMVKNSVKIMKFTKTNKGPNVPPPVFPKCPHCGVLLHGRLSEIKHECVPDECVLCKVCRRKYTREAYEQHMPFHKRCASALPQTEDMPMKKYISQEMWNILYFCESCEIAIDSYDRAVEHCQHHHSNVEELEKITKECTICKLEFETNSFENHQQMHSKDKSIKRESFKILKFSFESLFSTDWHKVFDGVVRWQVELIMLRSIYKATRCVKMWVQEDGPPERTLYKCKTCHHCVDLDSVADHALVQGSCSKAVDIYTCNTCRATFFSRRDRNRHERIHGTSTDNMEKSFRIVVFDNRIDQSANSAQEDKLKDVDVDLLELNPKVDLTKTKQSEVLELAGDKGDRETHTGDGRVIKIYKCRCGIHFPFLNILKKHIEICGNEKISTKKCSRCGLLFPADLLVSHLCSHCTNIKKVVAVEDVSNNLKSAAPTIECSSCHSSFCTKTQLMEHSFTCKSVDRGSLKPQKRPKTRKPKCLFKLYKCCECNVYFVKEGKCRGHATHHVPLDYKEYIECKLCGLQFTYITLHMHVMIHHKNDIKLEYIFVKEISSESTVKIEMYHAIEGVQSRDTTTVDVNLGIVPEKEIVDSSVSNITKNYNEENIANNDINSFLEIKIDPESLEKQAGLNPKTNANDSLEPESKKTIIRQGDGNFTSSIHYECIKPKQEEEIENENVVVKCEPFVQCVEDDFYNTFPSKKLDKAEKYINNKISVMESKYNFHDPHTDGNMTAKETVVNLVSASTSVKLEMDESLVRDGNVNITVQNVPSSSKEVTMKTSGNISNRPLKRPRTRTLKCLFNLYKCCECNVYFDNETNCRKHATNHVPFDNKEYINCKLCGVQFTYHTLQVHVLKHHHNDVEFKYVFVEEISSEKTAKIEMYGAIELAAYSVYPP